MRSRSPPHAHVPFLIVQQLLAGLPRLQTLAEGSVAAQGSEVRGEAYSVSHVGLLRVLLLLRGRTLKEEKRNAASCPEADAKGLKRSM